MTLPFTTFCEENGIKHELSCPRTPQQNGVVERKNRTLQEMARTMLSEYDLPHYLWAEAVNSSCYISNRIYFIKILLKLLLKFTIRESLIFLTLEFLDANVLF